MKDFIEYLNQPVLKGEVLAFIVISIAVKLFKLGDKMVKEALKKQDESKPKTKLVKYCMAGCGKKFDPAPEMDIDETLICRDCTKII